MAYLNYTTKTIDTLDDLINLGLNEEGLIIDGQKTTAGAPDVTAGKYIPGAMIISEIASGTYQNTGTTALPVWALMGTGGGGVPSAPVTSVQWNNAGAFGGSVNFIWDEAPKVLQVGDPNNFTNGTSFTLSDAGQTIDLSANTTTFYSPAQGRILGRITASTATIAFGDINPVGNNTLFFIDDIAQHISAYAGAGGGLTGTRIDMLPSAVSMVYLNGGAPYGFNANNTAGGRTEIISNNNAWIWPNAFAVGPGHVLTDVAGNGTLSWQAPAGGTVVGNGAPGQATYWTGAASISGSADFLWAPATKVFQVGDLTGTINGTKFRVNDTTQDISGTTNDEFYIESVATGKFFRTGFNAGSPFTHFGDLGSTGTDTVFALNDAGGTVGITVANFFAIDSAPAFTRWFRVDPPVIDIGDISNAGNSTLFTIDDTTQNIVAQTGVSFIIQNTSIDRTATFDTVNHFITLGDVSSTGNDTTFKVDDNAQTIIGQTTVTVSLGDIASTANSTTLVVDDVNRQVSFGNFLNVAAANAVFDSATHTANVNFNIVNLGDSNSSANDTVISVNDVTEAIVLQSNGTINIGDPASTGNDTAISMNDAFGSILLTANLGFAVRDSSNNFWYNLLPGVHSQTMGDISNAFNSTTFQVDDTARLIISQAIIAGVGGTARTSATGASMTYSNAGTNWAFNASSSGGGTAIITANNQNYSWPNVDGPTGAPLVTDGSGILSFQTLTPYASDAAAGVGGLTTGEMYQTDGTGAGVFAFLGVVMVKQ